jgi:hypothetical protein
VLGDSTIQRQPRAFELRDLVDSGFVRAEAILARPRAWHAAVAALLLLQGALILTHAAWLDEWQALQIGLQSPTLPDLFESLRYEGHPALWYLLLRCVALVIPYLWVLVVTQLAIALATQCVILFRSPFGRLERLLIGSSFFILFEFGTLSRSLGLGALLTIVFFTARDRRLAWAALILMPNVEFVFGLISIVGVAVTTRDGRFSGWGAALWLASCLFAAWTVFPAPDVQPALELPPLPVGSVRLISNMSALLIPFQTYENHIEWASGMPWHLGPAVGLLFIAFAIREVRSVKLHLLLFGAFLCASMAFSLFVYPLGIRHLTLVPLLLILLKSRETESGMEPDFLFRLWLVVIALGGLSAVAISINRPFDTAPRVAEFIRHNHLENKHWVSYPDSMSPPVAALLDGDVHTLGKGCTQSFVRWDFHDHIRTSQQLDNALRRVASDYGRYYLISGLDLNSRVTVQLLEIARFPKGYDGRPYYLYVIGPGLPESSRAPPPCAPRRIRLGAASLLH